MSRILCGAVLGWSLVGTLQATGQQAGGDVTAAAVSRAPASGRIDAPHLLPGTRTDVFATIHGSALTSTNGSLPTSPVRLRNARTGQIVDTQLTDQSGLFTFPGVDPGSYIVEVLGPDQASVVASSQILHLSAGDVVSAVVKLPFKIAPLRGIFGNSTSSAAFLAAQAAAAGVLATQVAGAGTCITVQ